MEHRARIRRLEDKEDLIDAVKAVVGREPTGIRQVLNLLAQPDILDYTIGYFDGAKSMGHVCRIFAEPWNCILEDEAKNETIRGVAWADEDPSLGVLLHEEWCDPCRNKVLGDHVG